MTVAAAAHPALVDDRSVLAHPLVYVTGKGGAGKTTVAAALGTAGALHGRRSVVCQVGGATALAALDGTVPTLTVEPEAALSEWMRSQPGGALAAALLGRSRAFTHFVEAAPGVKELVTVGKIVDLARGRDAYDLVVLDGPSTGHALAMLNAPQTVARVARAGPVGSQARALHDFLTDAARTALVGVSLPEEMPIHELLELEIGLREGLGRGLDLVVVNGVYPDRFSDAEAATLEALAATTPHQGRLRAALTEHRHAREHAARVARLREQLDVPIVTLPFVFAAELGPREYRAFARRICDDD